MRLSVLLITLALVAGCMGNGPSEPDPEPDPGPGPVVEDAVRFLAVGDTGTGEETQYEVAEAMAEVCEERGCDFVLLLGDNFYPDGVASVDDPQWAPKFEVPYAALDVPFYAVLGNHDYGPSRNDTAWAQTQVAYAAQSDKWTMPDRSYSFERGVGLFVALDSGPEAVSGLPSEVDPAYVQKQQAWLQAELAGSDAAWKVVFAHHPYLSNGIHGDAGSFDGSPARGQAWRELLESACADVDLHLAGHDHDLQWLEPGGACPRTHLVISGAGATTRDSGSQSHAARFTAFGTPGFAWLELTEEKITISFHDGQGALLFLDTETNAD